MYIKLDYTEYQAIFPEGVKCGEVELNGNKFYIMQLNHLAYGYREWYPDQVMVEIDLRLKNLVVKKKSKEEIAAEQSVEKAQEALEAAKKTLEEIKESK